MTGAQLVVGDVDGPGLPRADLLPIAQDPGRVADRLALEVAELEERAAAVRVDEQQADVQGLQEAEADTVGQGVASLVPGQHHQLGPGLRAEEEAAAALHDPLRVARPQGGRHLDVDALVEGPEHGQGRGAVRLAHELSPEDRHPAVELLEPLVPAAGDHRVLADEPGSQLARGQQPFHTDRPVTEGLARGGADARRADTGGVGTGREEESGQKGRCHSALHGDLLTVAQ